MKVKIRIDTLQDAKNFVEITRNIPADIFVIDNRGLKVNAKSLLGVLYSMEFSELWCKSKKDIYQLIKNFII